MFSPENKEIESQMRTGTNQSESPPSQRSNPHRSLKLKKISIYQRRIEAIGSVTIAPLPTSQTFYAMYHLYAPRDTDATCIFKLYGPIFSYLVYTAAHICLVRKDKRRRAKERFRHLAIAAVAKNKCPTRIF